MHTWKWKTQKKFSNIAQLCTTLRMILNSSHNSTVYSDIFQFKFSLTRNTVDIIGIFFVQSHKPNNPLPKYIFCPHESSGNVR